MNICSYVKAFFWFGPAGAFEQKPAVLNLIWPDNKGFGSNFPQNLFFLWLQNRGAIQYRHR
jgi:hypothetical protein